MAVPRGDRLGLGGPRIVVLADERGRCHLVNMDDGTVYWCCEDTKSDVIHRQINVEDHVDARVQYDGKLLLRCHQKDKEAEIIFLSSPQDEILQCLKDIYGNNVIVTKNHKDFLVDYNTGSITNSHASSNIFTIRRFNYECLLFSSEHPTLHWMLQFSRFECFFPSDGLGNCCKCNVYHVDGELQFFNICKYLKIETLANRKTLNELIWASVIKGKKISISEDNIAARSDKILMDGHFEKTTPIMIKRIERNSIDIEPTIKTMSANNHTNILRYYATEIDGDHYHMAFERCTSLEDIRLTITDVKSKSWEWLKVIRGIVMGIMYLHSKDVVHEQLCPANVFVDNNNIAKLMVIGSPRTNEEAIRTGKMDNVYDVGKLLLCCMSEGSFDFNTDEDPLKSLYMLPDHAREATDLITKILEREIVDIIDVSRHCLFWHPETRLSFTREASDRLLAEPENSAIILDVENVGVSAIIRHKKKTLSWFQEFDSVCLDAMGRYKYDSHSVCSLIRLMRIADSHFYELKDNVKKSFLVAVNEKNVLEEAPVTKLRLEKAFHDKFPGLLVQLRNIVCTHLYHEFKEYFENQSWFI